jgi:hypothetical protein
MRNERDEDNFGELGMEVNNILLLRFSSVVEAWLFVWT